MNQEAFGFNETNGKFDMETFRRTTILLFNSVGLYIETATDAMKDALTIVEDIGTANKFLTTRIGQLESRPCELSVNVSTKIAVLESKNFFLEQRLNSLEQDLRSKSSDSAPIFRDTYSPTVAIAVFLAFQFILFSVGFIHLVRNKAATGFQMQSIP